MAELAERRNEFDKASRWQRAAEKLRANVERHFWMEEKQFYALAMDATHHPCAVRASNAGHLLFAGLPTAARARSVIDQLLAADFAQAGVCARCQLGKRAIIRCLIIMALSGPMTARSASRAWRVMASARASCE